MSGVVVRRRGGSGLAKGGKHIEDVAIKEAVRGGGREFGDPDREVLVNGRWWPAEWWEEVDG